jgi:hypothetical protein
VTSFFMVGQAGLRHLTNIGTGSVLGWHLKTRHQHREVAHSVISVP